MEANLRQKNIFKNNWIKEYTILDKFSSKKNEVHKVRCIFDIGDPPANIVVKKFKGKRWQCRLKREYTVLKGLENLKIPAPKVYLKCKNSLLLEYIQGRNFLELLEESERKKRRIPQDLIYGLCGYIYTFNKDFKETYWKDYILGDINLKNFLVEGEKFYKVDFEECKEGNAVEDAGRLCAYFLTYRPEFSQWKSRVFKDIYSILTKDFNMDKEKLVNEIFKEFEAMQKRRDMPSLTKKAKDFFINYNINF